MDELLNSWTLKWFLILNVATILLCVIYYLFEKTQKSEK